MNTLKNILVPVDFSGTSNLLLKHAARLAEWNGATVHVLHVIPGGFLKHRAGTHGTQDPKRLEAAAASTLAECVAEAGLGTTPVKQVVLVGDPADCIVKEAQRVTADILVLSAHETGKKRLDHVASQCVRRAPCKVLLVRDWQANPFRRLAVCIDLTDLSESVFRQALRVARSDGASLDLVHVIYPVDLDYMTYKADFGTKSEDEYRAATIAAVEGRMDALCEPFRADIKDTKVHTSILESSEPANAITSHIRQRGHDLVVIGTTGRSRTFGLHFGSNAEDLVQDTPCSVLAVKPAASA